MRTMWVFAETVTYKVGAMLFFVNVTNRDLLIMEVLVYVAIRISNSATCFGSYIYVHISRVDYNSMISEIFRSIWLNV